MVIHLNDENYWFGPRQIIKYMSEMSQGLKTRDVRRWFRQAVRRALQAEFDLLSLYAGEGLTVNVEGSDPQTWIVNHHRNLPLDTRCKRLGERR
jgi:hypothetical protein